MSLSTIDSISKTVDYNSSGFSFLSTVSELIGNSEYYQPCNEYLNGGDNSRTFYWKALSAVGEDIADTVYNNVRNYIQYVSDVDTCKVRSLRSMMQLFNYKCTVLDNFISMPAELLKLMDILSIDKKYLKESGFIRPELAADMVANGVFSDYINDPEQQGLFQGIDFRQDFTSCTYALSTDAFSGYGVDVGQMQWKYEGSQYLSDFIGLCTVYAKDGSISGQWLDKNRLSTLIYDLGYPISAIGALSVINAAYMYTNKKNYHIIDDRLYNGGNGRIYVHDGNLQKIFYIDTSYNGMRFPGDCAISAISSVYAKISSLETSSEYNTAWMLANECKSIALQLSSQDISYDRILVKDEKYYDYIKNIYKNILYGYVTLPYNISVNYMTHSNRLYIYPYLGTDYFNISAQYSKYTVHSDDSILSSILDIKLRNHISKSFDEKSIYDNIDAGIESISSYAGAQLCILLKEKERREQPLLTSNIELPSMYSDSQLALKCGQTRYSYYRKQKVLEYANFIDRYYAALQLSGAVDAYDFNTNYWQLDTSVINKVITLPSSIDNINPLVDINQHMVDIVADYLAMATQYVCKLRHEIKLQTQKNYMRGTNLLLIYIINEYLRDYAKNNKLSSDTLGSDGFEHILSSLEKHSLYTDSNRKYSVNIQEYYDSTEYFNIKTNSTVSADMSSYSNPRFWEHTGFENSQMMQNDGEAFKLAEIERFYLSSLNLKHAISGNLPAFLSTIYDVGANNTFVYKTLSGELSIYSSVLSDKQFASDIFNKLVTLSNSYTTFVSTYLSDGTYSYPDGTVIDQISDVLSNYVYPNLSTEYLAGISDIYDKYKIQVDQLSSSIDSLSASYIRFTQTTYPFYYSKSTSKFCYSDHDVESGTYLYPYFNGNPAYDKPDDNLYNHLHQLQVYSTEQNIKNFALISALTYVQNEMVQISGGLQDRVITDLEREYGFIDISSNTIDSELQHAHDYINNLILNRQDFVKSQLAVLQTQAQSLKASYDNLNNTFTEAVANFNDNNDGYKLGDDTVYSVSTNKVSDIPEDYQEEYEFRRCTTNSGSPSKFYGFCVKLNRGGSDKWYFPNKEDFSEGEYAFKETNIIAYDPADSLDARCEQVKAYMNAPTEFSISQTGEELDIFGLQSDGIVAVCDSVNKGLTDIQTSFDNIAEQSKNLFGIEKPQQSDIYNNILELIEKLTEIDETQFASDHSTQVYKQYFKIVTELSSRYVPVKTEYNKIFTDNAQINYLTEFTKQDSLTFENVYELSLYIKNTDATNYNNIQQNIYEFINTDFQDIIAVKSDLQAKMETDGVPGIQPTSGNDVETRTVEMNTALLTDISNKQALAIKYIDGHKFLIYNQYGSGYFNVIMTEISGDLDSTQKFTSCVKSRLDKLNFFNHDIYKNYTNMFLTYGGRNFCYDPYYNIKNITHPSYEIHPYLWNFIQKIDTDTLINSGFNSTVVESLNTQNVIDFLRRKTGSAGQTIRTWDISSETVVDYSGYRSLYEKESNWSSKLNLTHEVIDYEGAFYPPALNEFREYPQQSLSSVYGKITKDRLYFNTVTLMENQLTDRISSYVTFNEDGTVQLSDYSIFASIVNQTISNYVPDYRCSFNDRINEYLADSNTTISTLNRSGIRAAIYNGIPNTFYEKYYIQVSLTNAEARRIGEQLQEYKYEIIELTDPKSEFDQYDIYKYGMDINKNHYILFKKYDYSEIESPDELTYDAKRNTLGRIWIRLGNHPIAFPAFSGSHPAYYIGSTSEIAPVIVTLAEKKDGGVTYCDKAHTVISSINDPLTYFYDFELAQNKVSIAYIIFDPKYPVENNFYRQFKLANVTAGKVETYEDKVNDILYLKFNNSTSDNGKTPVDYIDFHENNSFGYVSEEDILNTDMLLSAGVQYPALIGYHPFDNNSINFIYTYQDFRAKQNGQQFDDFTEVHADMSDKLRSFAVQIENGNTYKKIPNGNLTFNVYSATFGNRKIVGKSSCVGYNMNGDRLTFAYVTELTSNFADLVKAETISGAISISAATEGALITDPLASEMNSHDKLAQNVTLVEAQYSSNAINLNAVHDYNTNADISYIPVYPGYENEFNMPSCYGVFDTDTSCVMISGDYQNIELLGNSKDIERYIKLVNPDPDPYFDYELIKENTEFGRVYEDYKAEFEKTFTLLENPSLNFNSPASYGSIHSIYSTDNKFIWTINLNRLNPTPFGMHDLKTMQVIIYNKNTLGKNPYYIGKLWDFINEQRLNYNQPIDRTNNADFDTKCDVSAGEVKITGTHRNIHTHSVRDSNYIDMIDSIAVSMYAKEDDLASATLTFSFDINPISVFRSYAKIPQGEIKIMLYNNNDLEIYQYYHMLDAYGAVQCKYYDLLDNDDQPDDGRGWGIYYPKDNNKLSTLKNSFFKDKSGLKTYLNSIQLSDYEALSDVYVYRGNKMLSFKNEENYRFPVSSDLYYYPTLNISYPKKAANYVESNTSFAVNGSANTSVMYDIFDDRNLFIITLEDTNYIADKIGQIDIPILYNDVNDVRAYEDYLECTVSSGLSSYNYEKYDIGDPRIAQYLHFTSDMSVEEGSGIELQESVWKNKSMDDFSSAIATSKSIYMMKSEDVALGMETEYITTYASRYKCDISKFLRFYVNYRRDYENQSLDLYFNYFNYIDSPYVKIQDGTNVKIDTIKSTYLKLKSGEDGIIDIIVQFKYYIGSVLYGYKNVKVLSYHIYNISDDKPKFLMYKTYEIQKDQARRQTERGNVTFSVDSVNIALEEYISNPDQTIKGQFRVTSYSDKELQNPYDFYFDYPSNIVDVTSNNTGYYIDTSKSSIGLLHVIVTNPGQKSYAFKFETKYSVKNMLKYKNRKYSVSVDEATVYDCDGLACEIELNDSSIQFTYTTSSELLGIVKNYAAAGAYVAVENNKAVVSLSKV